MKYVKAVFNVIVIFFNFLFEFFGMTFLAFKDFWSIGIMMIFIFMLWFLGLLNVK